MDANYKERFIKIVEEYGPRLNKYIADNGAVYTLHDFDHHCCNIYKIISDVILNTNIALAKGQNHSSLTDYELYILNLAVLLHDIGMTEVVDFSRDNHSVKSAEIIKNDSRISANPLSDEKSGLRINDIKALMKIVKAHSDVKDGSVADDENGLNDPDLTNDMPGRVGPIRAKFLANILRMADELDVTSDRLSSVDIIGELESAVERKRIAENMIENIGDNDDCEHLQEKLERYTNAEYSYLKWKNLFYFSDIKCDNSGRATLCIDDEIIRSELEKGENEKVLAKAVWEVYEKILYEFNIFCEDINTDLQLSAMIAIKCIEYHSEIKSFQKCLKELEKKHQTDSASSEQEIASPHIISTELEKQISRFIDEKNLYEVGHFKLHDNLCSRDWISIEEIITTEAFFKKCEAQLLLHIQSLKDLGYDYIIIGVDFYGMLIASRLAFILKKPYTYVIPDFKESDSSVKETGFGIPLDQFDCALVITDVIVSYNTIINIMNKYNIQSKTKAIYAVLFRDTNDHRFIIDNSEMIKKTYVLNAKYNIEVHKNNDCRFRSDEMLCKAFNKTVK